MSETNNTIEERPSPVTENFKRWVFVVSILSILVFVYLLITMKSKAKEEAQEQQERLSVPQQVQDAEKRTPAIADFQNSISTQAQRLAPVEPANQVNQAPVAQVQPQQYAQTQQPQKEEKREKTIYEKFQEEEELRALRSIRAVGSIGDPSGFYEKDHEEERVEQTIAGNQIQQPQTLTNKQKLEQANQRVQEFNQLLRDLKSGKVDPSSASEVIGRQAGAYE